MSSTRLTNTMREAILKAILGGAFDEESKAITKRRNTFSLKVYNHIYPKAVRGKMYALPDGWLPESDSFVVQFGASSMGYCERNLTEKKRFLSSHTRSSRCIAVYDDSHALTKEHEEITKTYDDAKVKVNRARSEANSILNSCSTTRQLKELWPEITKYVELYEPKEDRTTAIVPITTELNKVLGLQQ